jgi:hypothetical protein
MIKGPANAATATLPCHEPNGDESFRRFGSSFDVWDHLSPLEREVGVQQLSCPFPMRLSTTALSPCKQFNSKKNLLANNEETEIFLISVSGAVLIQAQTVFCCFSFCSFVCSVPFCAFFLLRF